MGRSAEVFKVLQNSTDPLTCREICQRLDIDPSDAKSVAAVLVAYTKSGTVLEVGSKICSVTGHKAKTYVLAENKSSDCRVLHEKISSVDHVVTITFDGGSVKVDAYPRTTKGAA